MAHCDNKGKHLHEHDTLNNCLRSPATKGSKGSILDLCHKDKKRKPRKLQALPFLIVAMEPILTSTRSQTALSLDIRSIFINRTWAASLFEILEIGFVEKGLGPMKNANSVQTSPWHDPQKLQHLQQPDSTGRARICKDAFSHFPVGNGAKEVDGEPTSQVEASYAPAREDPCPRIDSAFHRRVEGQPHICEEDDRRHIKPHVIKAILWHAILECQLEGQNDGVQDYKKPGLLGGELLAFMVKTVHLSHGDRNLKLTLLLIPVA